MNREFYKKPRRIRTIVAHDAHDGRHLGAVTHPIYQNSLFTFANFDAFVDACENGSEHYIYTRGNNPTVKQLEYRLAELEHGEAARCFGSGMAAITSAIMSVVEAGDHIVCVDQAYSPARQFMGQYLNKMQIETTFVDGTSMDSLRDAVRSNTKLIYLESPSTLMFQLQDLRACVELARSIGAVTIIDNTWSTPCYQNPLVMGVDLVVHSLSKYINGHSDAVAGVVVGSAARIEQIDRLEYPLFGGILSPQNASLIMRGLRTLPIRMEKHEESGLKVAQYLQSRPFVRRVNHPGLPAHPQHALAQTQLSGYGSLFSIETDEHPDKVKAWIDCLSMFRIGVSWGGYESLILMNVFADRNPSVVVRLYIGLEDPDDLIEDLLSAEQSVF